MTVVNLLLLLLWKLFSLHFIPCSRSLKYNITHVKTRYKLWLPWIIS